MAAARSRETNKINNASWWLEQVRYDERKQERESEGQREAEEKTDGKR